MKQKLKRIFKRTVPLILVCSLTIGAVLGHNTKEVKAVAIADDILIAITLLAMCGVTWYGSTKLADKVADGSYDIDNWNWGDLAPGEGDLPTEEEKQKARELLGQDKWDKEVRKRAEELGYIDSEGNINYDKYPGGGSSGSGNEDPDDDKFPSWDKIKNLASTQKNLGLVLSAYLPFVALYGYEMYKNSIGLNSTKESEILSLNKANESLNEYAKNNNIDLSSYKYYCKFKRTNSDVQYYFSDRMYLDNDALIVVGRGDYGDHVIHFIFSHDGKLHDVERMGASIGSWSILCNNGYYSYHSTNAPTRNKDGSVTLPVVTPDNIDINTSLLNKLKNNNYNYPLVPIYNNVRLPTDTEFAQYLKDLKDNKDNNNDDEEKKKVLIDDFIKKLTTESGTPDPSPNPNPNPNPGGGETPDPNPNPNPGGGETPSPNPSPDDTSNESFTRDLKLIFPFCIPFDLVDCFKLFNAEPETPRIEVPMHFGIIDVDYTWVIDLKDFDSVAVICRSMFLILFLIGLALATSKVIKW